MEAILYVFGEFIIVAKLVPLVSCSSHMMLVSWNFCLAQALLMPSKSLVSAAFLLHYSTDQLLCVKLFMVILLTFGSKRDSCKIYLIGTYTLKFSQGQLWQTSMQVGVPVNESAKLNQVCNIV